MRLDALPCKISGSMTDELRQDIRYGLRMLAAIAGLHGRRADLA